MSKYGGIERSGATAFDDVDVARCYRFRPAYPPALYKAMLELSPGRAALLDLGCGTGKLASRWRIISRGSMRSSRNC